MSKAHKTPHVHLCIRRPSPFRKTLPRALKPQQPIDQPPNLKPLAIILRTITLLYPEKSILTEAGLHFNDTHRHESIAQLQNDEAMSRLPDSKRNTTPLSSLRSVHSSTQQENTLQSSWFGKNLNP
jgi:hypothetical protein